MLKFEVGAELVVGGLYAGDYLVRVVDRTETAIMVQELEYPDADPDRHEIEIDPERGAERFLNWEYNGVKSYVYPDSTPEKVYGGSEDAGSAKHDLRLVDGNGVLWDVGYDLGVTGGDCSLSAKRAFERIGFMQVRADDDYTIYQKSIDGGANMKIVSFCNQLRSFQVTFENRLDIPSINMELFGAITLQLMELGWIQKN